MKLEPLSPHIRLMNDRKDFQSIVNLIGVLANTRRTCECQNTLATAIFTDRSKITAESIKRLEPIVGKHLS